MYSTEHANLSLTTLLSELESNNDASELLRVVADEMRYEDLEEEFRDIRDSQDCVGHLTEDLRLKRDKYRKELKERGVNHPNWNAVKNFV